MSVSGLDLAGLTALHQPAGLVGPAYADVCRELGRRPPIADPRAADRHLAELARVVARQAMVWWGGDCAESFDIDPKVAVPSLMGRAILPPALIIMAVAGLHVVKAGRIAGQYTKPRSSATEDGVLESGEGATLTSFLGHTLNRPEFSEEARALDPSRLLEADDRSRATLAALRDYVQHGPAALSNAQLWIPPSARETEAGRRYLRMADLVERMLGFVTAAGIDVANVPALTGTNVAISHEALLIEPARAQVHRDPLTGKLYLGSTDYPWVGIRTAQPDGAHIALVEAIVNPVAVKVGPSTTVKDLLAICERLNPDRIPGRLTLIARMGARKIGRTLPRLMRAVQAHGHVVVWVTDPMHGNTRFAASGHKTRYFTDIVFEVRAFFAICRKLGVWPGGLHVEMTGEDVTECVGGTGGVQEHELQLRNTTLCDPRLNWWQATELAFIVARLYSRLLQG